MAFVKIKSADFVGKDISSIVETTVIGQAERLKALFDSPAEEVVAPAVNALIDALEADSAAANIGAVGGTSVQDAIDALTQMLAVHEMDVNNPHEVTKEQIGLGKVDNTSDAEKPISDAVAAALENIVAGAVPEGSITDAQLSDEEGAVKARLASCEMEILAKAGKSSTLDVTLLAANWEEANYTLSLSAVTDASNQEILPALNITQEELDALQAANLQDAGQSDGVLMLKAFGDVPSVDIPVRVIVRGDA